MDFTTTTDINDAITSLVSEYEALEGSMTASARGRRTAAMERLSAASFSAVTEWLDPYGMEDLNEEVAEATLGFSLFVTDLIVSGMLDFRMKARRAGLSPEDCRGRLRSTLLEIWLIALAELEKIADGEDTA